MATLLFIDTAGEKALVGISQNNVLLAMEENNTPNAHANFVQIAIETVLKKASIPIQTLDAIVVTMGPGSYTGLRVGLASAKGIAYVEAGLEAGVYLSIGQGSGPLWHMHAFYPTALPDDTNP